MDDTTQPLPPPPLGQGIHRRCGCRDKEGRQYTARRPCPKMPDPNHGTWGFRLSDGYKANPTGGRTRSYVWSSGYATRHEAEEARSELVRAKFERVMADRREKLVAAYTYGEGNYTAAHLETPSFDPELARKAKIYDDLKTLGLLEQMGITE